MLGLGTLAIDRCDGRTSALSGLPQREKGDERQGETGEKKETKRQLSTLDTTRKRWARTTYDARVDPRASILLCCFGVRELVGSKGQINPARAVRLWRPSSIVFGVGRGAPFALAPDPSLQFHSRQPSTTCMVIDRIGSGSTAVLQKRNMCVCNGWPANRRERAIWKLRLNVRKVAQESRWQMK